MFRCVIYIILREYLLFLAHHLLLSTVCYVCYIGCAVDYNLYVFIDFGGVVVKALRYKPTGRGFDSRWCHWDFSVTFCRSHYDPGVDSASNSNEYQVYFLGVKAAGAQGWQPYHHPVPWSWNLRTLTSWNPLGHSRPVTGLLYLYLYVFIDLQCIYNETVHLLIFLMSKP
jgi:hypothetical protein